MQCSSTAAANYRLQNTHKVESTSTNKPNCHLSVCNNKTITGCCWRASGLVCMCQILPCWVFAHVFALTRSRCPVAVSARRAVPGCPLIPLNLKISLDRETKQTLMLQRGKIGGEKKQIYSQLWRHVGPETECWCESCCCCWEILVWTLWPLISVNCI